MPRHSVIHMTDVSLHQKIRRPFSYLERFVQKGDPRGKQTQVGRASTGEAVFSLFEQQYEAIILDLPFPDMGVAQVVASIRYLEKELKRATRSVLIAVSTLEDATKSLSGVDAVLYVKRGCEG